MTATKKHIPGKRIKTWHRNASRGGIDHVLLRDFVRGIVRIGIPVAEVETCKRWLAGKGIK